jgi:hypothetical protein
VPRATCKVSLGLRRCDLFRGGQHGRNYYYSLNKKNLYNPHFPRSNSEEESSTRRIPYALRYPHTQISFQDVKYNGNWMGAAATTAPVVRKPGKITVMGGNLEMGREVVNRRTDRIPFPHILSICVNAQSTAKAIGRRAPNRSTDTRSPRQSEPASGK